MIREGAMLELVAMVAQTGDFTNGVQDIFNQGVIQPADFHAFECIKNRRVSCARFKSSGVKFYTFLSV